MPDDARTPGETPPPEAGSSESRASESLSSESLSSESRSSESRSSESLSSESPLDPRPTGRDRLWGALTARPSRAQVVVGVLLASVGFAAMTQVRSNEQDDQYGALRQSDLIRVLDGLAGTAQRAETEIDRLRRTRDDLQTSTSSRQAALDQARQESNTLSILAGTVPTVGPGVRITITDDRGEIQDETLIDIIQELRAAGAEAMEFNDRIRVVAQTSVEETSRGIEVDGQVIDAPYVIDAIGEPTTLAGSLDFATGPVDRVRDEGGTISFDERDEIEIESVVPDQAPRYAEPDDGQ